MPFRGSPGKFRTLRACFILMFGASVMCVTSQGAAATKADAHAKPSASQSGGLCRRRGLRHVPRSGSEGVRFQSSHQDWPWNTARPGPPARVATARAKRTLRRRRHHQDLRSRQGFAKEVDETCLGCHAGAHPNFERSPHAKANVGCTSCHSVHASTGRSSCSRLRSPRSAFSATPT
jgi:hypothetical protein